MSDTLNKKDELLEKLRANLPAIWERTKTTMLTGGVVRSSILANLMSQGDSPEGAFRTGRKICLEREGFLKWLFDRIEML